ncbi:lactate utilization protein C [Chitinophagaceae bacterium LWZ2-11]
MSSRNNILQAITKNKPVFVNEPVNNIDTSAFEKNLPEGFIKTLEGIGGKVIRVNHLSEVATALQSLQTSGKRIVNAVPELSVINTDITTKDSAESLENVNHFFIKGQLGVAENGAVWIEEERMQNRLLPFICQHLVIVLNEDTLVPTMHHAYKQIDVTKGYGVFIAGPSKTADIEQSLVIGAHGARSLVVYLIS